MPPERSRIFEQGFLDQACRSVGLGSLGFQQLVAARLEQGQQLFGDRALYTPLRELVREIREEFADVATWSLLTAQSEQCQALDLDTRVKVVSLLQAMTAEGARGEELLRRLGGVIDLG